MQNEELKRIIATQEKLVIKLKEKTDKTENRIHELELQMRGLEALFENENMIKQNGTNHL